MIMMSEDVIMFRNIVDNTWTL